MIRCSVFMFVITFAFFTSLVTSQRDWERERTENEYDFHQRDLYRLGEFNERCGSKKDCRQFRYVCRDNRTCQCDFMYIPDANKRSCLGGVNQRCVYDEHCIEGGAFCMNQAVCKCKNSSPIELEDGLICAGADEQKPIELLGSFIFLTIMTLHLNIL